MSDLLEYALQRFDLLGYVQHHGGEFMKQDEWLLYCPKCGKQKLTVNLQKKAWHCWHCQQYRSVNGKWEVVDGAGGLIDLVQLLQNCSRKQAVDVILSAAFMRPDDLQTLQREDFLVELAEFEREAVEIPAPHGAQAIDGDLPYLWKRAITPDDVRQFGLYWCDNGRYANRLVFPVWENGRHVYFQARAMWEPVSGDKSFRKALNPPSMPGAVVSTEVLMNLDVARNYPRVVVTEGPMDCLRAGPEAVCTFGKAISGTQIFKLVRAGVRALDLMWDADAKDTMIATAKTLVSYFDLRLVFLPRGDPADFTREQLYQFRHAGQRLDDYRLVML